MFLIDIFKTGKEQYPDKTAIIMGEDTRTYGDIFDNAKKLQVSKVKAEKG